MRQHMSAIQLSDADEKTGKVKLTMTSETAQNIIFWQQQVQICATESKT